MPTRSVKLAQLFGIRIGADPSWFLALFLIVVLLGQQFDDVLPDLSQAAAYGLAVGAAVLFFGSLVIHELGHALVGRRFGIHTVSIDLWLLGGVARLDRDARTPKEEFVVAAAGPLGTLLAGALCVGAGIALSDSSTLLDAALLREQTTDAGVALFGWGAAVNGVLFCFNLIPAFPLDGGRIARAIAWKLTGSRRKATVAAGQLGRGFALVLAAVGLWQLADGSVYNGVWFLLIAWFIGAAARAAVVTSEISEQLHTVTAGELMEERPVWVPADATVLQAEHETFGPFPADWAAVLDGEGHFLGIVTAERVTAELAAGRPEVPVRELLATGDDAPRVPPDATLEGLLSNEPLRRLGALPVVDATGVMRGLVTFGSVRDALAAALPGSGPDGSAAPRR
ncbi:site-2 protease family protein [Patulibacter defluvii]|uniref:site-2 protease family protein n=1 Tax=Patulibacter defluvii TaxID=3095358 RepID=UPI002A759BA8|nr:site-2 protease family protein [Patulibacter sp. DM4]